MLTVAAVAVAAGSRSVTAIWEWAADLPQWALRVLGSRFDPRQDRYVVPGEATLRRTLAGVDGDELDTAISAWITHHAGTGDAGTGDAGTGDAGWAAVALDGKTLRGTVGRTGGAGVHLLSALTHQHGTVVGQRLVSIGDSEIAEFEPLLASLELAEKVVTADALHTTRDHATYLRRQHAHYVFIVKKKASRRTSTASTPGSPRCPGQTAHTTPPPTSDTGGSNNAPSTSCPPPPTSTSPAPRRVSRSPATAPTAPPANARHTPGSASPASPPTRPPPTRSPPCYADTGRSRTDCTGSATSPTAKTTPAYAPAPHPAPWPACATSPSAHSATPAGPTSPKPSAT